MVNNSAADSVYKTWCSSTKYDIASGQTKGTYFAYPDQSQAAFSATWKCLRGVMKDTNSEVVYYTKTICRL